MSNNTPRRSQRLATQHDTNPYNIAARKALNKPELKQARPYNEYNQAVNSLANSNRQVQPHKSVTPTEMKDIIMQEYGMTSAPTTTQDNTSDSTIPQEHTAPPVQNASSSSSPADTTIHASVTNVDKGKGVEQQPLTFHTPLFTKFVAAAPVDYVQGKSVKEKIRTAERIMMNIDGFLGATQWSVQKEKFIVTFFDSKSDLLRALDIKCTYKVYHLKDVQAPADPATNTQSSTSSSSPNENQVQQQNYETCEYTFVDFDLIKQPKTVDDINAEKERTIQVLDIPLKISTASVRTAFSKYGEIQKLTLRTKGPFQQAFITYQRKDSIAPFYVKVWSVYMMRHALRTQHIIT